MKVGAFQIGRYQPLSKRAMQTEVPTMKTRFFRRGRPHGKRVLYQGYVSGKW